MLFIAIVLAPIFFNHVSDLNFTLWEFLRFDHFCFQGPSRRVLDYISRSINEDMLQNVLHQLEV
jgi:hypothetical protein